MHMDSHQKQKLTALLLQMSKDFYLKIFQIFKILYLPGIFLPFHLHQNGKDYLNNLTRLKFTFHPGNHDILSPDSKEVFLKKSIYKEKTFHLNFLLMTISV